MAMLIEKIAVFGRAAQRTVSREFTKRLLTPQQASKIKGFLGGSLHEVSTFAAIPKTLSKDIQQAREQVRQRAVRKARERAVRTGKRSRAVRKIEQFTPKQMRILKSVRGKTIAPPGGTRKLLEHFGGALKGGRKGAMTKKLQALSKEDVRVLRSVIGAHELAEVRMGVKKKLKGPMFFSHVSPAILLDESSRLSALNPEYSKVKDVMRYVRKMSGEEDILRKTIPGYIHGASRYNKSQRRRLSEIITRKQEEGRLARRAEFKTRVKARRERFGKRKRRVVKKVARKKFAKRLIQGKPAVASEAF